MSPVNEHVLAEKGKKLALIKPMCTQLTHICNKSPMPWGPVGACDDEDNMPDILKLVNRAGVQCKSHG